MSKDLIIVESPAKVKTIGKFLGRDFKVAASVGHVRDLPVSDLGVDEDQGFAPRYEVIKGKEEVVKRLRKAASQSERVFLAPDPDREGEAIAWHVAELIRDKNQNISRISFNEITARAVREALASPRPLDRALFDSQQARRVLDRLVGYKLSPLLWKKVKRGISAGRVQSVALKLVVEREKERRAFEPREYWPFTARLAAAEPPEFWVGLWKRGGKAVEPGADPVADRDQAEALEQVLRGAEFIVDKVEEKKRKRAPNPPYITSTLQQDASNRLGFSAKKTMSLAQRLYEGVELGDSGVTALITYMRTDSTRVAKEAQDAARALILERYGKEFCPAKPRTFKAKGSAQDAHEAVRPVDVGISPDAAARFLPRDQLRLYTLIWQRFVASQMAEAVFWDTLVLVRAADTLWRVKGERLLFPGFLEVMGKGEDKAKDQAAELPGLAPGDVLRLQELGFEQKFTQPPARYTEAGLVKELEEKGIGRPSTYAAIISTLLDREYVRLEKRRFAPSELGVLVSDQLSEHFSELMDVGFTASMETKLDEVALGRQDWMDLIADFAAGFYPLLDKAGRDMVRAARDTGVTCDKCGRPMVVKFGRNGEFLGCSGYPECKNIRNFTRDEKGGLVLRDQDTGLACDKCGRPMVVKGGKNGEFLGCSGYPECRNVKNFQRGPEGEIVLGEQAGPEVVGKCPDCGADLVVKRARNNSRFVACSAYPKCRFARPFPTGVKCPREGCGGELVEKASRNGKVFYSCSRYPECDYALWDWPVEGPCPECGHPVLVRRAARTGVVVACPRKGCGFRRHED